MHFSRRSLIISLSLVIVSMLAGLVTLYPLATRPLIRSGDEAIVERARSDAPLIFHEARVHERSTFPIVMKLVDRTCVELRSWAADGAGSYLACYDKRTGKKVEERSEGGF